jgi:hypothetical protein
MTDRAAYFVRMLALTACCKRCDNGCKYGQR